jgi:hypothetical protein
MYQLLAYQLYPTVAFVCGCHVLPTLDLLQYCVALANVDATTNVRIAMSHQNPAAPSPKVLPTHPKAQQKLLILQMTNKTSEANS